MIEIKMIFRSIDEAIVVMGHVRAAMAEKKVSPAQPAVMVAGAASGSVSESGAGTAVAGETPTRKPRSDAGKKRGPYKNVGAGDAIADAQKAGGGDKPSPAPTPEQQADAAQSPVAVTPGASGKPEEVTADAAQPAVAVAPSDKEVQELLAQYHTKVGTATAMNLISSFGVKRGSDIKGDDRVRFVAAMREAINGK